MPLKSTNVIYFRKTTNTDDYGRQVKYTEEESFIIKVVVTEWEIVNTIIKSPTHNLLISQFGREYEADQM